jgi:hypothetical protein
MPAREICVVQDGFVAEIDYRYGVGAANVRIRRFNEATYHLQGHHFTSNPIIEDYETASSGAKASAKRAMKKLAAAQKTARDPAAAARAAEKALLDLHERCHNGTGMDDLDSVRPDAHKAVSDFLRALGHDRVADAFAAAVGKTSVR